MSGGTGSFRHIRGGNVTAVNPDQHLTCRLQDSLAHALPRIVSQPDHISAREAAQYGAWLCETVPRSVGMALHHKLCHIRRNV
ncbi:iron-containing alcohol dehydrogenase [Caballeronia temeraria]|uniref:Iron-containing alcohol dehydrogenase n=1 Tax=Caballeronia temeraria TaxID=1777137 RepID=A0A158DZJ3_9BURK|nr:iron-containing alcohol dehydrogenase [Caballeronia temeraria]